MEQVGSLQDGNLLFGWTCALLFSTFSYLPLLLSTPAESIYSLSS